MPRENLKDVDPAMETELAEAAEAYVSAPKLLQAAIIKAAGKGETAPKITNAIKQAYSVDYVRQIIREARDAGKIPPRDS